MSPITKEWLQKTITSIESARDEIPFGLDEDQSNMLTAFKIALASLELERGIIRRFDLDMSGCDSCGQDCGADMIEDLDGEYVLWDEVLPHLYRYGEYTAPPETVSVPDAMEMDDDFDSAFEHGKAVGWNACRAAMLQSQGNCIKDGWISCSDRMPEDTKMLLAFSQGEIVAAYWNWVVNPIDYKKYRAFTYLSGNILDDVTHWMQLPEPPL
ncbi:DUF551 domain-containing protein [Escherichia coli]|nr:DUF551 domain-containing protein [Escherichia coli]EJE7968932.1 DUF551 domain-containing protein [Escherichia coli]EJE8105184.1 DUF551 domain-containing protein [Escherichia coli]